METFDSSAPAGDYRLYPLQAIPYERVEGKLQPGALSECVYACVCLSILNGDLAYFGFHWLPLLFVIAGLN